MQTLLQGGVVDYHLTNKFRRHGQGPEEAGQATAAAHIDELAQIVD